MAYTSNTHPFYCRYISATENLPIILRVSVVDSPLATPPVGTASPRLPHPRRRRWDQPQAQSPRTFFFIAC